MGLFNNLLKQVDNGLKAVESGALEKRLNQFADTVEKRSTQAEAKLAKAADKPGEAMKFAATRKDAVEARARVAAQQIGQSVNQLKKKD